MLWVHVLYFEFIWVHLIWNSPQEEYDRLITTWYLFQLYVYANSVESEPNKTSLDKFPVTITHSIKAREWLLFKTIYSRQWGDSSEIYIQTGRALSRRWEGNTLARTVRLLWRGGLARSGKQRNDEEAPNQENCETQHYLFYFEPNLDSYSSSQFPMASAGLLSAKLPSSSKSQPIHFLNEKLSHRSLFEPPQLYA